MTRGKGFIDQPLAFSVLEQASKLGIKTLDLRNLGEPILDKRLPVFAEHAKNLGFSQIYIHTNAYRLTPDLLSVWKKSGITKVLISISPKREFTITRPGTSVDKFFNEEQLKQFALQADAKPGDLILILAGPENKTRKALSELRLEMGNRLGLRPKNTFAPLWVLDFPLLEWDEDNQRYHAMHHPFTSPKPEDRELLASNPGKVRANAYDLVINGVEIGGGSIRIHDRELQKDMFTLLGFSDEEALKQFGFLMNAFEYGAPPHGGIALGFDRLCAIFGGADSIRDFIAFPKNNSGRDMMIDAPSSIAAEQMNELGIALK
jgi:aspartyl-tRNA synthetase